MVAVPAKIHLTRSSYFASAFCVIVNLLNKYFNGVFDEKKSEIAPFVCFISFPFSVLFVIRVLFMRDEVSSRTVSFFKLKRLRTYLLIPDFNYLLLSLLLFQRTLMRAAANAAADPATRKRFSSKDV